MKRTPRLFRKHSDGVESYPIRRPSEEGQETEIPAGMQSVRSEHAPYLVTLQFSQSPVPLGPDDDFASDDAASQAKDEASAQQGDEPLGSEVLSSEDSGLPDGHVIQLQETTEVSYSSVGTRASIRSLGTVGTVGMPPPASPPPVAGANVKNRMSDRSLNSAATNVTMRAYRSDRDSTIAQIDSFSVVSGDVDGHEREPSLGASTAPSDRTSMGMVSTMSSAATAPIKGRGDVDREALYTPGRYEDEDVVEVGRISTGKRVSVASTASGASLASAALSAPDSASAVAQERRGWIARTVGGFRKSGASTTTGDAPAARPPASGSSLIVSKASGRKAPAGSGSVIKAADARAGEHVRKRSHGSSSRRERKSSGRSRNDAASRPRRAGSKPLQVSPPRHARTGSKSGGVGAASGGTGVSRVALGRSSSVTSKSSKGSKGSKGAFPLPREAPRLASSPPKQRGSPSKRSGSPGKRGGAGHESPSKSLHRHTRHGSHSSSSRRHGSGNSSRSRHRRHGSAGSANSKSSRSSRSRRQQGASTRVLPAEPGVGGDTAGSGGLLDNIPVAAPKPPTPKPYSSRSGKR